MALNKVTDSVLNSDKLGILSDSVATKANQTDMVQHSRLFKPLTNCFMNRITDEFSEQISTDSDYQSYINVKKQYTLDGFFIIVEIQPSASQQTAFNSGSITESALVYRAFPLATDLINSINMCVNSGLKFLGIKAHCKWAYSKWGSGLTTAFFTAYKNAVSDMITALKNAGITFSYLTVLNEAYNMIYSGGTAPYESYVVDILNTVHNAGYKTGVCGMDISQLSANIIAASDLLSIHTYPPMGNKGANTKVNDCITAWECTRQLDQWAKYYNANPTKEFWIMETGTMSYYESLAKPDGYYGSTGTYDSTGWTQYVYFTGMFEYFRQMPFIKGVNLFYLDATNYHSSLGTMFDRYLRSVV